MLWTEQFAPYYIHEWPSRLLTKHVVDTVVRSVISNIIVNNLCRSGFLADDGIALSHQRKYPLEAEDDEADAWVEVYLVLSAEHMRTHLPNQVSM